MPEVLPRAVCCATVGLTAAGDRQPRPSRPTPALDPVLGGSASEHLDLEVLSRVPAPREGGLLLLLSM